MAMQSFACIGMDKDNDQKLFAIEQQQKKQEERISLCSPIDSEFAKYFPSKRLPLPPSTHTEIIKICTKPSKERLVDTVQTTPSSPIEVTNLTSCPTKYLKATEQPLARCKKQQSSPSVQIKPTLVDTVVVRSQNSNGTKTPLVVNEGKEEVFFDTEAIANRAIKLYLQLLTAPRKNRINSPYLHKSTNQLFLRLDESRSCVYNATSNKMLILEKPYEFPNEEILRIIKDAFAALEKSAPLQFEESVLELDC